MRLNPGVLRARRGAGEVSAKGAAIALACVAVVLAGAFAVHFAFSWVDGDDPSNILTARDGGDIRSLFVATPSNNILWKIDRAVGANIEKIGYGVIPAGFVQAVPGSGLPRALVGNSLLLLRNIHST